ncbi:MAG: ABC transporter permease [Lewinella sp.]|jgi:lipopolysaccharide transport system permease protein|uniref:ABC transporter permease n=1 Tax=Lewinella sp. TaxID=2004506 RepID=UPI003D6A844D
MNLANDDDLIAIDQSFKSGILKQMYHNVSQLKKNAFLIWQLVKVNVTSTYKRSFIGLSWMVITPLLAVVAWVLLQGAGIMDPGDTAIPYPAYVLLSTSIWSFFLGAYQASSKVLVEGGRLMITIRFPHVVLIAEKVLVHMISFVIPFAINLIVLLLYGIPFTAWSVLFPLTLIPLLFVGVGLGLLVSLMRVVAVDLAMLVDKMVGFLMFLTPVIYAPKVSLPILATVVSYNPLTYLIGFSRDLLTAGTFFSPMTYLWVSLGSVLFLGFGFWAFTKFERKLVERMINV